MDSRFAPMVQAFLAQRQQQPMSPRPGFGAMLGQHGPFGGMGGPQMIPHPMPAPMPGNTGIVPPHLQAGGAPSMPAPFPKPMQPTGGVGSPAMPFANPTAPRPRY